MSSTTVKKGVGLYLDVVAVVLAVVGIIAAVVSTTMGEGYEFSGLAMCICLAVVAIALVAVAAYTDLKSAEKGEGTGIVSMIALGVAIFLMVFCGVQVVASRALAISGLFSWNSMDTTGWQMFYAAATSAGGFVLGAVLLTVACFLPTAKKA